MAFYILPNSVRYEYAITNIGTVFISLVALALLYIFVKISLQLLASSFTSLRILLAPMSNLKDLRICEFGLFYTDACKGESLEKTNTERNDE